MKMQLNEGELKVVTYQAIQFTARVFKGDCTMEETKALPHVLACFGIEPEGAEAMTAVAEELNAVPKKKAKSASAGSGSKAALGS